MGIGKVKSHVCYTCKRKRNISLGVSEGAIRTIIVVCAKRETQLDKTVIKVYETRTIENRRNDENGRDRTRELSNLTDVV